MVSQNMAAFFSGTRERDKRDDAALSPAEEAAKVHELATAIGTLSGQLKVFASDECLHRYLRARNWNVRKAEKMLRETLKWRREFRPEAITWADVASEAATGKVYRTNFLDKKGRSVLVMCPGKQNTSDHVSQIRHLVYCLENAIISLPPGTEQMVWLIDYRGWTLKNTPPLKTAKEVLSILQNHYPERLGAAILYDPPPIFQAFWKMIKPFIDPKTFNKIMFVYSDKPSTMAALEEAFDLNLLEKSFGGRSSWEYDNSAYGQMMEDDDRKSALFWGLNLQPTH